MVHESDKIFQDARDKLGVVFKEYPVSYTYFNVLQLYRGM